MPDEFVRKEVYEADLKRIETLMEKTLIEMKADNEKLRSEVKADNEKLRSEVKADNEKLRGEFNVLRGNTQTAFAEYKAIALETRGDVRVLAERIGILEAHITTMEYWGAIIIGAATIAFGLAQFFQNKRESIAAKVREEVNELRKTVLMLVDAGKIAAP